MRLERVIQVRKLMFIRSILVMEDGSVPKTVFCERAKFYFDNVRFCSRNDQCSPVFDMLNVCSIFGFLEIVKDMVTNEHYYPKVTWREMVWKKTNTVAKDGVCFHCELWGICTFCQDNLQIIDLGSLRIIVDTSKMTSMINAMTSRRLWGDIHFENFQAVRSRVLPGMTLTCLTCNCNW